ncbi:MAG: thiol reductant ABC exporter subunit CydC [Acidimicrobiia bacterium]
MNRLATARRLLGLLRPLAPLMVISSACRVINQTFGIVIPALAAAMIMDLADGDSVAGMVGTLAILAIVKGLFRYLEQFTGHAVAFRLLSELRVDVYRHLVPLAPAGLETERSGDLVARIVGDVDRVEPFYAHTIAPLVSALVVPLLASAALAIGVDPLVALVFLPFPLAMVLGPPWIRSRRVADLSSETRVLTGEAGAVLTDAVQGSQEIAVLGAGAQIAERIGLVSAAADEVRGDLARISAVRAVLIDLLAGGAVVAVAAAAIYRFGGGAINLAAVAAAVVVAWVGTAPARALEEIVPDVEQALAAAGRLFELADRPPPVQPAPAPPLTGVDGSVDFEAVSVVIGSQTVLDSIDCRVDDGSMVAVVGPSGSGKSTLVELLVRFRDPDRGRVLVGGVDLRLTGESDLRQAVALVPQRPDIFFGTIADNLRLARPGATDDELWHALERAALSEWVRSLGAGLDTPIGESGESMSGGQRQRLSIGRALLRDPRVLILDEATSELDSATAQHISETLGDERGRRTVIVVAHRLETVQYADEVLVMDGGRLVERGTHEALLRANSVYAGLWSRHEDVLG